MNEKDDEHIEDDDIQSRPWPDTLDWYYLNEPTPYPIDDEW